MLGQKAIYYRGLIETQERVPWVEVEVGGEGATDAQVLGLYDRLAEAALELRCNAIVSFEIAIDPFGCEDGVPSRLVELSGTAVQLQPVENAAARKRANLDRVARVPLYQSESISVAERKRRAAVARRHGNAS